MNTMRGKPWVRYVEECARKRKLDADLVMAIIEQESGGAKPTQELAFRHEPGFWRRYLRANPLYRDADPLRVSSSYGLMQIMYTTAVEMGFTGEPEELVSPRVNIDWGTAYFASCLRWANGNVEKALSAYNGGRGTAAGPGPWPNQGYVDKVLQRYRRIKEGNANA